VDMRGEAGLLSRNVKISGDVPGYCDPQIDTRCQNIQNHEDLFGGHIMGKGKFKSYKIENAEVTNMGQHGVLARYPIHWHMTLDIVDGSSYVKSNSIHHNFQRCVTCHGSFGCVIENNMAFETFGHCYFMEDGVERDSVIMGNLGANTRKGFMIPSDSDPSTFWITHPLVTLNGNVAGGSEGKGFWFLYPYEPTGLTDFFIKNGILSIDDYYTYGELHKTAPRDISNNVAHSSVSGYFYDNILTNVIDEDVHAEIGVQGTLKNRVGVYDIRSNPAQPKRDKSDYVWAEISDITCYKTSRNCLWMSIERIKFSNLKIAESSEGMFSHEEVIIEDSLFVGFSERNIGEPNVKINGEMWHRSLSPGFRGGGNNRKFTFIGYLGYRPPITLSNTQFVNFYDEEESTGIRCRALSVETASWNNIRAGVYDATFVNTPLESRMVDIKERFRQSIYNDFTGSISGHQASIVSALPHLITQHCYSVPSWMDVGERAVCPHKYLSLQLKVGKDGNLYEKTVLQREDMMDQPFIKYDGYLKEGETQRSGVENMYYLNTDFSHMVSTLHQFSGSVAAKKQAVQLKIRGLDDGVRVRIGFCLPRGAEIEVKKFSKQKPVDNFEDLGDDFENSKFFHDKDIDVVFFMLTGSEESTIQIGDTNNDLATVRTILLHFRVKADGIGDCRDRVEEIRERYQPQTAPDTTPMLQKPDELNP